MDIQPSMSFDLVMPSIPSAHNQIAKFETLCHVVADISGAPFTIQRGTSGTICYCGEYDIVLLVGLTELKAQIRWTDSTTVRIHE